MKKQDIEFITQKNVITQKKLYKKPQLSAVMLFADQVLTGCRVNISGGCGIADPANIV